jgi:hypothetical protein
MEKPTFDAFAKELKQEFKPPEDLPVPLQRALEALAKLLYGREKSASL